MPQAPVGIVMFRFATGECRGAPSDPNNRGSGVPPGSSRGLSQRVQQGHTRVVMAQASWSFDDERIGLFDLSHDAFFIAGFDGYLKRANSAFARSLGYTLEEMLARPFMDRVYPDDV